MVVHKKGPNKSSFTRNRNKQNIVGDKRMSLSQIKKKIRDTKRAINREGAPSQLIIENKRKLRALEFELGERTLDEFERSKSSKYHKVKHFERNKTERKLKQAKRKLEEAVDEDSKRAIDEEIQELEIRLLYITHHPRTADYVSLYPKSNENDPKSQKKREKLLNDIKQALKDGDKDLVQLNKRYRENYKEQLIKRGILQPVTPVDIENLDTSATKTGDVEVHEGDTENNDDFFEM